MPFQCLPPLMTFLRSLIRKKRLLFLRLSSPSSKIASDITIGKQLDQVPYFPAESLSLAMITSSRSLLLLFTVQLTLFLLSSLRVTILLDITQRY
jgi:hypothetical protein